MKVSTLEIYLFRLSQGVAFLLLVPVALLNFSFLAALIVILASLFIIAGLLAFPILMALIVFDFISDFSSRRFSDPMGRSVDLVLFFPDALWSAFRFILEKTLVLPRAMLSYATE